MSSYDVVNEISLKSTISGGISGSLLQKYEHGAITPGYSVMENVDIYGAGILHEEKIAAIQAVHRVPTTANVRITNCAWNAYDYIAPRDEFEVSYNELHNNNGYGVGGLVLNGDSNYDNLKSSFIPLRDNAVPYKHLWPGSNVHHRKACSCSRSTSALLQVSLLYHRLYQDHTEQGASEANSTTLPTS